MSGHSHFATIRRQKETKDAAKGKIFSKMGRAISIAVKEGGGPDPNSNFKLRVVIETARAANMPKANIDRAIENAAATENVEEIMYEGFGPGGVGVLVAVATDNRNRTAQELKNVKERVGGSLAGPGAVSYDFEPKGFMLVTVQGDKDAEMLKLIDLGVEDLNEAEDGIEVYTPPTKLFEIKKILEDAGIIVKSAELIQKPKTLIPVKAEIVEKVLAFLETLEDQDDVQKVYTNADI
jgi:YebC/PmpR family DNA-binding regulatory protein